MLRNVKNLGKQNKYKLILIMILIFLIISVSISIIPKIIKVINERKASELEEVKWQIYNVDGNKADVLITFGNKEGIKEVSYQNYENERKTIYANGKLKVALDYKMEEEEEGKGKVYKFDVVYSDETEKEITIDFKIPRIEGVYEQKNGIYFNKPDISTGFSDKYTRYMYLNNDGNLVPGNWINKEEPENWYDYSSQNWANLYVENEGAGAYYVWIPRYCYKVDEENSVAGNERMDVKFIDVYNRYKDTETGLTVGWEELKSQGYKIPEAFSWSSQYGEHSLNACLETIIPGYWISKYQLSEVESYIINYTGKVNLTSIEVSDIELNTDEKVSEYIYAIDGDIIKEPSTSTGYKFDNVKEGDKTINVTALDENGEIIGSMTKTMEVAEPNEPELSAFDKDTTFYVYWDANGKEHNEIPISMDPPSEWYNYTSANWANIVTRNNGLETYYVWIPRYEYMLNNISKRSYVKFLKGTTAKTTPNYQIPEAFWWDNNGNGEQDEGEQLTGYWITKYQLTSENTEARINAKISVARNVIGVKDITGTELTTKDEEGNIIEVPLKYEYYINGEKVYEGTNSKENFVYTELQENTTYAVNIIARRKDNDEYIGAITKKITTTTTETDIEKWIQCANLQNKYKYQIIEQISKDNVCIEELMSSENALDYMVNNEVIMSQIGSNENVVQILLENEYALKKVLTNDKALQAIVKSEYGHKLDEKAKTPQNINKGEVIYSSYKYEYIPSNVFDGDVSTQWWTNSLNGAYIGYDFKEPINIYKITLKKGPAVDTYDYYVKDGHIQYSDDGETWTNASETGFTTESGNTVSSFSVNAGSHRYWRITCESSRWVWWDQVGVGELEMYGIIL